MRRRPTSVRLGAQDGYTAIEMIITMALTGLVSGAIFSSFLVLDRIQTAWEQRDQARAVGVLAEQPLLRDVQAYKLEWIPSKIGDPPLKLKSLGDQDPPLEVVYSIQTLRGQSVLNRTVTQGATTISKGTVAHGVQSLIGSCPKGSSSLTVDLTLDALSTRNNPQPVKVSPSLQLTMRNGTCP